jgi:DDE superfamily endonuclease
MIRCCEDNRRSDGSRRPQRRGRSCPLAGVVRRTAGSGRWPVRLGRLRWRARAFVRGLLADPPRKNCWTLAEHAGDPTPDGMQHLLARAVWDEAAVRDDIRGWVVEHLGDPGATLSSTRPGTSRRAPTRWGPSASTPGPLGGSRTPRSRSTWSTPPTPGTGSWTGSCACPAAGPTTRHGAGQPACPRGGVCDHARAGPGHDRPGAGRRGAGRLGDR